MELKYKFSILKTYNFFIHIITPFFVLFILIRFLIGKETIEGLKQKLVIGRTNIDQTKKYIWVHGASVGELSSVFRVIKDLITENKDINILFTSSNFTVKNMILRSFPEGRVIHKILPIDNIFFVERFLKNFNPILCVWIESELWPNYLINISKKCKIILMNARMSDKSFNRWKKCKNLLNIMLDKFFLILPQSPEDLEKYSYFASEKVKFIGNIKFAAEFKSQNLELEEISRKIVGKRVFLAASTHPPEDIYIAKLFNNLRKKYQDLILIIAPRSVASCKNIAKDLRNDGNQVVLRSEEGFDPSKIYIIDNVGELVKFYKIADVIFMGKSLGQKGGHNPLEPIKLAKFVFSGPYVDNFRELVEELVSIKAMKKVNSWEELEKNIDDVLLKSETNMLSQDIMEYIEKRTNQIYQGYKEELQKHLI